MNIRIDWPPRGHGYTEEEIDAVARVMRATGEALTQGACVQEFEEAFSDYLGVDNAFTTMSCAHALDIAGMLADVQPGNEVIIPAHTYCASAISFARRGAIIKWADICPDSLTITLDSIRELTTDKTKAIVAVHLYGLLCPEITGISSYAAERDIVLIEDCAQALGAMGHGKHAGTFGDIGCYSFHSQKNLTTLGEGGMIVIRDPVLAEKVPGLRMNGHVQFGEKPEYWLPAMTNVDLDIEGMWPIKSTMNEAQAAVGIRALGRLDELTRKRRERGLLFREAMKEYPELSFQKIHSPDAHSHHLLPASYRGSGKTRDDLIRMLSSEYGIKAIIQYYPLNRYDLFRKTGHGIADIPETDRFFDNMISFPFSVEISDEDFQYMIESTKKALARLRA